jgi:hypothetical protein
VYNVGSAAQKGRQLSGDGEKGAEKVCYDGKPMILFDRSERLTTQITSEQDPVQLTVNQSDVVGFT